MEQSGAVRSGPEQSGAVLLTIGAAADYLSVSVTTVRRLTHTGELTAVRLGRLIRYQRVDLDALVERLRRAS
jgi:excisionase family DNA binding protein